VTILFVSRTDARTNGHADANTVEINTQKKNTNNERRRIERCLNSNISLQYTVHYMLTYATARSVHITVEMSKCQWKING